MDIAKYFSDLIEVYNRGNATEHSYRAVLQKLFDKIDPDIQSQNEPERLRDVGAPDFSFHGPQGLVIGHAEAKKLGIDLKAYIKKDGKEQYDRYRKALPNLIYTDGLTFLFLKDGEIRREVTIGENMMGFQPKPDQFDALEHALKDFAAQRPQMIRSPATLAKLMAGKAVLIKDILRESLLRDEGTRTELEGQYKAFKEHLIHDITPGEFADIYAETIAYGMFAARLHDETKDDFSRQEALELLPKSNPFLRNLFTYIAGPNLDDRIRWVIDDLAKVFRASDLPKIMEGFGSMTQRRDPFIHFYEDFLSQYNPKKRKARGVWYTPEPVVNFIVRAVDEVLQTEFGLPMGLATTDKITVDWDTGQADKRGKPVMIKKEVHRVQVLDPATGTGTFLAEVIKQVAERVQGIAPGQWSQYVEQDLIPRLHGFELLMASYAMCHMKLDMMLTQMGYQPSKNPPRMSVYLTNSLEEGEREVRDLFLSQWLTNEAREANTIKRQTPIMCVIGNPPYSGVSSNTGEWATSLIAPYKLEPGGKTHLKERNSKWINDDYVKFIRYGESVISKNGSGVLAFITNHGYIDSPTFRGMRWHLMQSFDQLYVLDLHGNSKKKEVSPDGSSDVNVFDIQQGVALLIAVKRVSPKSKKAEKPKPGKVHHAELWGVRKSKYDRLQQLSLSGVDWCELDPDPKYQMFYPINRALLEVYDNSFDLSEFMPMNQIGFQSHRDGFAVDFDKGVIETRLADMLNPALKDAEIEKKYELKSNDDWNLADARKRISQMGDIQNHVVPCDYRPFDRRYCLLDEAAMDRPRWPLLSNTLEVDSFALNFVRQTKSRSWQHGVVSKFPAPAVFVEIKDGSNFAPLYIYENLDQSRRVNFDPKLWKKLQKAAKHPEHGTPDEVACFDYIYGVLHCPAYRETYAEFLKIDFPRIPWPKTPDAFWDISGKGTKLRQLHLMEPAAIGAVDHPFEGQGDSVVDKPSFKDGRVWINKTQSFAKVPELAWEFYIGGYQPAQKWLKDRKGRALSFDDILHYQRIIKILTETDRIMKTIDMDLS